MSNRLYLDQIRHFVGPDLGPNGLQSPDDKIVTMRQKVNPLNFHVDLTLKVPVKKYLKMLSTYFA